MLIEYYAYAFAGSSYFGTASQERHMNITINITPAVTNMPRLNFTILKFVFFSFIKYLKTLYAQHRTETLY